MTSHWYEDLLTRCVGGNIVVAHDAERDQVDTWIVRVDGVRPQVIFAGALSGNELSDAVDSIESVSTVWRGEVKRGFPKGTYRLLWTLPPAPFQLYTRKRLIASSDVDSLSLYRRFGRLKRIPVAGIQSVESWMSPSGFFAGVSLVLADFKEPLVRLFNLDAVAGVVDVAPYNQWGVEVIDAVAWAGSLGRTMAVQFRRGGSEDRAERWKSLNHAIAVNNRLGQKNRVAMTNRRGHSPTLESNEQIYLFFEHFLGDGNHE